MRTNLTKDEFYALCSELKKPCVVPVIAELPQKFGPAEAYITLSRNQPISFLLESAEGAGQRAKYSYIGTDSLVTLRVKDGDLAIGGEKHLVEVAKKGAGKIGGDADAAEIIKKTFLLDQISIPRASYPKFICGPVGYFAYDMIRRLVDIGSKASDDLRHPDAEFMLARNIVAFDHAEKKVYVCSNAFVLEGYDLEKVYVDSVREIETKIGQFDEVKSSPRLRMDVEPSTTIRSNVSKNKFISAVKRVQKYIDSGEIFQLVFSRRVETDLKCDPYLVYLALREINPSPYMYYLDFGLRKIIGSSPETLVRVENGEIMTRPIGGTRRRGKNAGEDKEIEKKLLTTGKEMEEHKMLVNLGREDVSKVAKVGSVNVKDFMSIERYSHVMHIVSTVTGVKRKDKDEFDVLRANFPAGTVVGTPRLRAMEIIEELEPTRRGIYAGGVGYFDYRHNMDFAIAIRTIVAEDGRAYAQVGAGILSKSVPRLEFYETENKGRALLKAIGIAEASSG